MDEIMPSSRKSRETQDNPANIGVPVESTVLIERTVETLRALLSDVYIQFSEYGAADLRRDEETLSRRMISEGFTFASVTLPSLFDSVLDILEGRFGAFEGFRLSRKGGIPLRYPAFLQGLVRPILDSPYSDLAIEAFRHLRQICYAFRKHDGQYKESTLREQLRSFVQTDIDLGEVDISSEATRDIARRARQICTELIGDLNPTDPRQVKAFMPRPGPGATNEFVKHVMRFRPHKWYSTLDLFFSPLEWHKIPPIPEDFDTRMAVMISSCAEEIYRREVNSKPAKLKRAVEPTSRLCFVPKTRQKARIISIEENETQWLQQSLRHALYEHLENHPKLHKGAICFTEQGVNQQLALENSVSLKYATIDMSEASNRIIMGLVGYLLGGNKALLDALYACRSEVVELPQIKGFPFVDKMRSRRFAPMGSATCFPVMGLVHYALVKAVIEFSSVPQSNKRKVYVYGDDMIIPTDCVQAVYDYLPLFGMKLNTKKSFHRSHFRESCGTDAYMGEVVTPTYIRCTSTCPSYREVNKLDSLISQESALYRKGYSKTARVLRHRLYKIFDAYRLPVYIVDSESCVLGIKRDAPAASLCRFEETYRKSFSLWSLDLSSRLYLVPKLELAVTGNPPRCRANDAYLCALVGQGSLRNRAKSDVVTEQKVVRWQWTITSGLGYRC